jgi:hypothetical protein
MAMATAGGGKWLGWSSSNGKVVDDAQGLI